MQESRSQNHEQLKIERARLEREWSQLQQHTPPSLRRLAAVNAQLSLIEQLIGPDLSSTKAQRSSPVSPTKSSLFVGRSYPKWWNSIQCNTPRRKTRKKFVKRRLLIGALRTICAPRSRLAEIKAR